MFREICQHVAASELVKRQQNYPFGDVRGFLLLNILSLLSLHEIKKLGTSRKKGKAIALMCVREREGEREKNARKARLHFALKKERTSVTEYNPPSYYCSSEKLHGNRVLNGWDQSCPKLILRPGRISVSFFSH